MVIVTIHSDFGPQENKVCHCSHCLPIYFAMKWCHWIQLSYLQCSKHYDHGIRSHYFMANKWGNNGNSDRLYFLGVQNHCRWWLQPWNLKTLAPWKKSYDKPRQYIEKTETLLCQKKGPYSQSYGFSSSHNMDMEIVFISQGCYEYCVS